MVKENNIIYRVMWIRWFSRNRLTSGEYLKSISWWWDVDENFFQLRNDDDAYDFHAYACITEVDGDIYLEHDVNDIKLKVRVPRCINGMTNMEGLDDDGIEDFDDSEDERTIAIIDGFYGMDVNLPINQEAIVAG